jgi:hypothetical protein
MTAVDTSYPFGEAALDKVKPASGSLLVEGACLLHGETANGEM